MSIDLNNMTLNDILKLDMSIFKNMDILEIKKIDIKGLRKIRNIMDIIRARKKGYKDFNDYCQHLAEEKGFKNLNDYHNTMAKKKGYKDRNEYQNEWRYKNGSSLPMNKNKLCSLYLGIYIAENVLSKIFENVQRMPINNKGYDFICEKGYMVDVKSSSLHKQPEISTLKFEFNIKKNKYCDYFLLIGFDNRYDLNPLHIWLIKSGEIVRNRKLNELYGLSIPNTPKSIKLLERYEITDKLYQAKECCDKFKQINNIV